MKKFIMAVSLAVFVGVLGVSALCAVASPKTGDIIQFGEWDWRVLDVRDGKALILTEHVIERRPYDEQKTDVTWETCDLRKYLNGGFLRKFSREDQGRIAETKVSNPDNPYHGTNGGGDTIDKVFLLSIEEAEKYFDTESKRIAADVDGNASWWWLRSPADTSDGAASVGEYGYIDYGGDADSFASNADNPYGGVRPALWLEL
ncbi:MAG: DUF6273 domain-containing protein [Synergistaceae bacterium]|nr:DUF6273 domain-containing protein [Synergistaceae bacterium]